MILKVNSIVQHVILNKNEIIKHVNDVKCKNYCKCKEDYSRNPSTCICENSKYLKSVADTSVTEHNEIVVFMDIVSTKKTNTIEIKMANTIATNITSTTSINCHSKKISDCYILHTVLLVTILLLIIIINCYHYAKQKGTILNEK